LQFSEIAKELRALSLCFFRPEAILFEERFKDMHGVSSLFLFTIGVWRIIKEQ
jgi:hypothetical protein